MKDDNDYLDVEYDDALWASLVKYAEEMDKEEQAGFNHTDLYETPGIDRDEQNE